jgi:hypothetical protein
VGEQDARSSSAQKEPLNIMVQRSAWRRILFAIVVCIVGIQAFLNTAALILLWCLDTIIPETGLAAIKTMVLVGAIFVCHQYLNERRWAVWLVGIVCVLAVLTRVIRFAQTHGDAPVWLSVWSFVLVPSWILFAWVSLRRGWRPQPSTRTTC